MIRTSMPCYRSSAFGDSSDESPEATTRTWPPGWTRRPKTQAGTAVYCRTRCGQHPHARGDCRNDEAMIDQSAMRRYRIVRARWRDVPLLGAIELAAAELLRGYAPDAVLDEVTDEGELQLARRERRLWVALAGDAPVGFAHVELLEPDAVHLEELDVHPEHGRRSLGARLVASVCRWAEARGSAAVTLTTFRDVPWNMPFYSRIGFAEIPPPALTPALRGVLEARSEE